MKFLAITLLAVCLIQGNSAQFAGLRNLVSNAQSAVSNAASSVQSAATNAASSMQNAASGAIANAANTANNIRSNLSGSSQAILDSASADISIDSLTEAAKNLSPSEVIETLQGAAAEATARVQGIEAQLEEAITNVARNAEASLNTTIGNWNSPIAPVLQKALAAGIDVKDCAVEKMADLAKESVGSAVKCVTDKVNEALTLAKNVANVPVRAATLAKDGAVGVNECRTKTNSMMRTACKTTKVVPVVVKSALLVKDTVSYARQATTLVSTLQTQLSACAAGVAAKSSAKAAATGAKVAACVAGKLTGN